MKSRPDDRLRGLLASRALFGLSREAEAELSRLYEGPQNEPDDYELAAAAVYLALSGGRDPLPRGLRQRVERSALESLGQNPE